jgi:hypothetical protein
LVAENDIPGRRVEWVLLRSSIGVDSVVNEFVVLSVDDVVLVLADYVHG